VTQNADRAFHSWAYWQFKYFHDITTVSGPVESFYNADGSLQDAKVAMLSRTYARAIAGRPLHMRFDPDTGAFRLVYIANSTTSKLSTDVYFNEATHYSGGYTTSFLNGTLKAKPVVGSNLLQVVPSGNVGDAGLLIDVAVIRPFNDSESFGNYYKMTWNITESSNPAFIFTVPASLKWWKELRVYTDMADEKRKKGALTPVLLCTLTTEGSVTGPKVCPIPVEYQHRFLFDYYVEIWEVFYSGL